ncbi:mitochondrial distribution and morphology [Rhodotorula sphaerocarpa]
MAEATSLVRAFYASRRNLLSPADLRSIGPICTAIEAHNPKRALLLCDQLLKRTPAFPSALALKAIALCIAPSPLSTTARNDIAKIVETARNANGGAALDDADVLMLLTYSLRHAGRGDDALDLLAKAVQKNPDNEELAMDAFVQYLRVDDCKAAQQISMRMAKQFKEERYLWWSILTTILQIRDLSHPQGPLLLSLAERQLAAHYANEDTEAKPEQGYVTANEFHLVTRILELRAQYAAAAATTAAGANSSTGPNASATTSTLVLPTLSTLPSGEPRSPARALLDHLASPEADRRCDENLGFELWRREVELEYGSAQGGEWKRLWERLARAVGEKGDTNWHSMLYLIRSAVAIADASAPSEPPSPPSAEGAELLERTRTLLRGLATDSSKAKVERGYLLGVLEVAREIRSPDKLADLLGEYFDRFGTKACCFDDLRPYIDSLAPEELTQVLERLEPASRTSLSDVKSTTRAINAFKLLRRYSPKATADAEHEAALKFAGLYFEALPLGKDLPPTELQPADDFALLAGQAWVSAYQLSRSRGYLELALALSEHVLQKSKYKYQIRILAINLLRLLGASSLSLAHYRLFGVKNVQYDTLSHLILARGATFAITGPKEAGVMTEGASTIGWYGSGQREARELYVRAFTNEAYTKVEDFYEFRQHLENSLQEGLATIEILRMSLLTGTLGATGVNTAVQRLAELLKASPDSFPDHRDFKTLPDYQPRESRSIWTQTEMGPRSDLTAVEEHLVQFSLDARAALVAELDQAQEAEKVAITFFQNQMEAFADITEDEAALPWAVLHRASVPLEAFLLLELGIERRLEELVVARTPEHSKHAKRLRSFRNAARDAVKPIGPKVTAYSKRVAKERPKIVAGLADLQRFEPLDENRLTNFAHALVDSRRSAAEALGLAFNRRTAK